MMGGRRFESPYYVFFFLLDFIYTFQAFSPICWKEFDILFFFLSWLFLIDNSKLLIRMKGSLNPIFFLLLLELSTTHSKACFHDEKKLWMVFFLDFQSLSRWWKWPRWRKCERVGERTGEDGVRTGEERFGGKEGGGKEVGRFKWGKKGYGWRTYFMNSSPISKKK